MAEQHKKSSTRDTFESLVVTVILAIFGTTFIIQAFKIPTPSMENTLLIGDHLLVNKLAFGYQFGALRHLLPYRNIQRGDVVVFKHPPSDGQAEEPGEHYVKRVIGVPGDRIRIVHRRVFVNGEALEEPYVRHLAPEEFRPGDDFPPAPPVMTSARWATEIESYVRNGELVVPPDRYFVMGDNREQSWDSRFWGFVPRELVSGRPLVIYWSYETPRDEYTRNSLVDRISQIGDLVIHFFTKTRWRRTLQLVR